MTNCSCSSLAGWLATIAGFLWLIATILMPLSSTGSRAMFIVMGVMWLIIGIRKLGQTREMESPSGSEH